MKKNSPHISPFSFSFAGKLHYHKTSKKSYHFCVLLACAIFIGILFPSHLLAQGQKNNSQNRELQRFPSVIDQRGKRFLDIHSVVLRDLPIVYDNGILFTYAGEQGSSILVSGSFVNWKKQFRLQDKGNGIFYVFFEGNLPPGKYNYRYVVNDFWENDPLQPFVRLDSLNRVVSYFEIDEPIVDYRVSPVLQKEKVFRFYLKDEGYQFVSWVGTRNHFDPTTHTMKLEDGYWSIEIRVEENKSFYAFYVDGQIILDPGNQHITSSKNLLLLNYIPKELY